MQDAAYILEEIRGLRKEFNDQIKLVNEELKIIKIQTIKTNGRVDSLMQFREEVIIKIDNIEEHINNNKGRDKMISWLIGGICGISVIILTWALSKH